MCRGSAICGWDSLSAYTNRELDCKRPTGVEPASRAWEARVIPVYDGRVLKLRRFSRRFHKVTLVPLRLLPVCGRWGLCWRVVAVRRSRSKTSSLLATFPQGNPRAAPTFAGLGALGLFAGASSRYDGRDWRNLVYCLRSQGVKRRKVVEFQCSQETFRNTLRGNRGKVPTDSNPCDESARDVTSALLLVGGYWSKPLTPKSFFMFSICPW